MSTGGVPALAHGLHPLDTDGCLESHAVFDLELCLSPDRDKARVVVRGVFALDFELRYPFGLEHFFMIALDSIPDSCTDMYIIKSHPRLQDFF